MTKDVAEGRFEITNALDLAAVGTMLEQRAATSLHHEDYNLLLYE
jgi:hypothetical protein